MEWSEGMGPGSRASELGQVVGPGSKGQRLRL